MASWYAAVLVVEMIIMSGKNVAFLLILLVPGAVFGDASPEDALELNGMTFGLRTLGGETNSLKVGENIHYKLEIALPKGPSDLLLEVHTLDSPASANRTSLSLYNFTMPYQSIGIVFNHPRPKFHLSNKTANVFDRMTVDFGSIKNNGPERNTLIICFSVVLVRKPKRAKKKHTVAVGVEFGKGQTELAWVAQSEISTASLLQKDDQTFFEANFTEAPETIALNSAATFRMEANLQFRSDYLQIDVNKSASEYEPDNLVSLGLIAVTKFGRNFQAIPQSPRHYRGYRNHTVSQYSFPVSVLDMDLITNNGEPKSRTFLKHPDNTVAFAFSVFALDYEENVGRNVSINVRVQIGRRTYYQHTLDLTIGARNKNEKIQSLLAASRGNFTAGRRVIKGGITALKIKSRFDDQFKIATNGGGGGGSIFADYTVVIEVPSSEGANPLPFIPCAGRLINEESGLNLPYLNPRPIKPATTSGKPGKFIFDFGRLNFVKLIHDGGGNNDDDTVGGDDNDLTAEIIFRASFAASAADDVNGTTATTGAILAMTEIKATTVNGQRSLPLVLEENGLTIASSPLEPEVSAEAANSLLQLNTTSSVPWSDLIIGGGIGINVRLEFHPNTAFENLSVEIEHSSDATEAALIEELPRLKICRFSVVKVSEQIPCTCVERDTINRENVFYYETAAAGTTAVARAGKSFADRAAINFGSISVANSSLAAAAAGPDSIGTSSITETILTNFVVTTIDDDNQELQQQKSGRVVAIKINVIDGGHQKNQKLLSTDIMNLNISPTFPTVEAAGTVGATNNHSSSSGIDFDVQLLTTGNEEGGEKTMRSIIPGLAEQIMIRVHIAPYTMGPLTIQVEAPVSDNGEDDLANGTTAAAMLSICGLWIHRIGYNMPCVDNQTAETGYEFTGYGINRRAVIRFATITNFGSQIRKSAQDERHDNTLEFITMVRLLETVSVDTDNNQTAINITVNYGPHAMTKELKIPVAVGSSMEDPRAVVRFVEPAEISLIPANDGRNGPSLMVHRGVPKLFHFDMKLAKNSQTALSILMEPSGQYKMCNAAMIKVGRNYPCYSPFTLKVQPNQFDLGIICHTQLNASAEEDELRLAFALRPNDNGDGGPVKVAGTVYRGPVPINRKFELSLTVAENNSTEQVPTRPATVEPMVGDHRFKIRERKWLPFRVRIPAHSIGPLTVVARGQANLDRAFVVVYDLRLVSAGQNIPCPFENRARIELNSTTGNQNQLNQLRADLGYFSNFGFTYHIDNDYSKNETGEQDGRRREDDSLKMEILAELTDHPGLSEDETYGLQVETHYGSMISQTETKIGLNARTDDPDVRLDVVVRYRKRMPVLDRNDTFMVMATMKHLSESNAEPSNVALRFFTPSFVEISAVNWASVEPMPSLVKHNDGSTDILFPRILFNEEITVNFTIQMDPKNLRGYGRDETTNLAPFRMMCEHHQRALKFPCSRMKFISFRAMSSECTGPLGMENGTIVDEQISASSTVSQRFHPRYARPKSTSFWSPAIRNWPQDSNRRPYIQIDFRRRTRLVRVEFRPVTGMRKVTTFHIDYSHDGKVWYASNTTGSIMYQNQEMGEGRIEKPIETRFIRLVIDSADSLKSSKNQYLAVKFELYGCYLESAPSANVSQTGDNLKEDGESQEHRSASTHLTDDPEAKNRHVSIDPYTNVIYFCDQSVSDDQYYLCYHSDSGGNSWTVVGRSIDLVEGFELATGKFYAIDQDRPAYFYSGDGINWTPIDRDEYNVTVSHPKFQKKLIIPRLSKRDMDQMDVRRGNWRANYDGLNYEDYQYPKAYWTKCCGLD